MNKLIIITILLFLSGCTDNPPEHVPLNIIDKSNEVCQSLDGVKSLRISSDCVTKGKICSNVVITTAM